MCRALVEIAPLVYVPKTDAEVAQAEREWREREEEEGAVRCRDWEYGLERRRGSEIGGVAECGVDGRSAAEMLGRWRGEWEGMTVRKKFCRTHVYLGVAEENLGDLGAGSRSGVEGQEEGSMSERLKFGLEAAGRTLGAALSEAELAWSDVYVSAFLCRSYSRFMTLFLNLPKRSN